MKDLLSTEEFDRISKKVIDKMNSRYSSLGKSYHLKFSIIHFSKVLLDENPEDVLLVLESLCVMGIAELRKSEPYICSNYFLTEWNYPKY